MLIEERKVAVDLLRQGMFVCRLDRDWAETHFLLQGFLIDGDDDIAALKRYCAHVYIDVERSHDLDLGMLGPDAAPTPARPPRTLTPTMEVDVLGALAQAADAVDHAAQGIADIYAALRGGDRIGRAQVDAVVQPILSSLSRHPDAFFWLQALRRHDDYSYGHAVNCSALAVALGWQIGLPEDALRDLAAGCLLIDIGMVKVPQRILAKPGALSLEEHEQMRGHVQAGVDLYAASGLDDVTIVEIIRGHHERHDGSGYPERLKGTHLPLYCRIAGLVDSYDAMVTPRPYQPALSRHDALQRLYRERNRLFQDELIEQFMQCMGIYPVGSLVELASGEVAIVMAQNRTRRLRPTLMLLTDACKQLRDYFLPVDLLTADRGNLPEAQLRIVRGLEPGAYGLDPAELYL